MTKRRNPFVPPQCTATDRQPLCPWRYEEHEGLYVAIGSSATEFANFTTAFDESVEALRIASVVLAGGGEGCGKSAFINRCIAWLARSIEGCGFEIFDLTDEVMPGAEARVQVGHLSRRLVDVSVLRELFAEGSDQQRLETKADDPHQAIPLFAELLRRTGRHGILIVPALEVLELLKTYASLARPGITIFAETSADDVFAAARAIRTGARLLSYRLDVLDRDDGWRFIQARLDRDGAGIKISQDTVDTYMDVRISGQGKISVRELELACRHVYEEVSRRASTEIVYLDFQDYYMRRGVVS